MKHKKIYPTFTQFDSKVYVYLDKVVAHVQCLYCGGKMTITLNGNTSKVNDDLIKYRVLQTAQKKHQCSLKISQWTDPKIAEKIAPDIIRGYEKLKEKKYASEK